MSAQHTREKILQYIGSFQTENGYLPSQSEIARHMQLSRQNIQQHFKRMPEILNFPAYQRYRGYIRQAERAASV